MFFTRKLLIINFSREERAFQNLNPKFKLAAMKENSRKRRPFSYSIEKMKAVEQAKMRTKKNMLSNLIGQHIDHNKVRATSC